MSLLPVLPQLLQLVVVVVEIPDIEEDGVTATFVLPKIYKNKINCLFKICIIMPINGFLNQCYWVSYKALHSNMYLLYILIR